MGYKRVCKKNDLIKTLLQDVMCFVETMMS